jgi:subfamily B ATP-binding cassette protein MsbA
LTPGEFVAFITAMSMIFEPVRRLTNVNATLQRGLAAAESIFALLDERGEVGSTGGRSVETKVTRVKASAEVQRPPAIDFESVFYRYPGSDDWSVKDFSLHIPSGQSVALVGPSGSGKSSLLHLLCGFDLPTQGRILIDQRSVDQVPLQGLRAQIALVGQQVLLFDLSVAENLRVAKADATDAEIIDALRAADAYGFVSALPKGINSSLGPLGNSLSGGQRQRLSVARAFLKDASVLLLDEPTSALDRVSEAALLSGLADLMVGRTTILVSHSPERVFGIDRIIDLSKPSTSNLV